MSDIVTFLIEIAELQRRISQHERCMAELRTFQAAGWPNAAVRAGQMTETTEQERTS